MDCSGCRTFACLTLVTSILQITSENVVSWLVNHSFGAYTQCLRCKEKPRSDQCFKKLEDGSKCRLKIPKFGPFFPLNCRIVDKFRCWLLLAQGNLPLNAALQALRSLRSVLTDLSEIERIFSIPRSPHMLMKYVMVDETYIGKRLHHRGRQVRKQKFWFMTATEVDPNTGKSLQTYWEATVRRTREVCHRFVRSVIENRNAMVITDEWAAYRGIDVFCRHYTICHADAFSREHSPHVNIHINNAESAHASVKGYCKRFFHK